MTRHRQPAGRCFPTAAQEARERGGEIVHAIITHPWAGHETTGKPFWHAWVERDGLVYDDAQHRMPIAKFYELFQPKDVRRYSHYEANTCMLRTRHHGPWESGEMGDKPSPPRKKIRRSR